MYIHVSHVYACIQYRHKWYWPSQVKEPTCSTNFNLVTINGECKCRCRTTNWCPSGQLWNSNICACVNDNICTLSCVPPKIRHPTQCKCICGNSCIGAVPDPYTCHCPLCNFEGICSVEPWSAYVIHCTSELDLTSYRKNKQTLVCCLL